MSVAEMQQSVAKNVSRVEDVARLDKIVHIIEEDAKPEITAGDIWAEIKAKHDGLMKRLCGHGNQGRGRESSRSLL